MAIIANLRLLSNSNDYSGNGNNGTDTNISYVAGGPLGKCARLTTNTISKIVGTFNNFTNGDFAVSQLINMTGNDLGLNTASFSVGTGVDANSQNISCTPYDNLIYYTIYGFEFSVPFTYNIWHNVVTTYTSSGNIKEIFIDGISKGTNNTNTWGGGTNWKIGQYVWTNNNTDSADIGETKFYNNIPSKGQIKNQYAFYKGFI